MSTTMESKSASDTREHPTNSRVSSFDVRPSVAGMIGDSEGNLDEKKAVAALSQTHNTNKYLWTGAFVLFGVVLVLIAANIGVSVAVARLTRQLIVDPVTGMATIPGSDDIVMKTSIAVFKEEDISFHTVPIDYLSAVKTVEFKDGDISLDVKGFARMTNNTTLLVEGGSLIFDINGLKNITGDELTLMFSSINDDINSSDLDGRKLFFSDLMSGMTAAVTSLNADVAAPVAAVAPNTVDRCGPDHDNKRCHVDLPYCNTDFGWCRSETVHRDAQPSDTYDYEFADRCGQYHGCAPCRVELPYCNQDTGRCRSYGLWGDRHALGGSCGFPIEQAPVHYANGQREWSF